MSDAISSLLVSFGGQTLRVLSDSPQISSALRTHLRHCRVDAPRTDVITELSVAASTESTFAISEAGNVLFSGLDYDLTLQLLMTELISRLVTVCERSLVLHAAALAHEGSAVVLCAQSGGGKSSLAAWLTADGFQYMTDEVIEIPLEDDCVHGFPRSIFLKRGSAFIWHGRLPQADSPRFLRFADNAAWIDPQFLHPNETSSTAAPRILLFPRYVPKAPLQAELLTKAEALFHLLQTLVNARNLPGHGMDAAARLTHQVTSYSLTYSSLEEASKWIRKTLQRA